MPIPIRQPVEGGSVHYGALPLSQPSYRSHYISSSIGTYSYVPWLPFTLPARGPSSNPPAPTGWFGKSSSSSPVPSQQSPSDQSIPLSPTPSLRVIEPPTPSSAAPAPAVVTVNTAAVRHMLNIPLHSRSKMTAQEEVVAEGQGTPLCYTHLFY